MTRTTSLALTIGLLSPDADEPRAFKSPPLDTDDHFDHVFTAPGTFHYFCSIHPHMQGMIVVR